jgi:hypothetical protein
MNFNVIFAFLGLILRGIFAGEFSITVKSPQILATHFSQGILHLNIIPGKEKTNYNKLINIQTLSTNKSGCRKYTEDFHNKKNKEEYGILLVDNDSCSLSTKIHYAQLAGVSALFLKYLDDNIEEAEIDKSSFEGVHIPVFMLKDSDAQYINEVLNSTGEFSHLAIELNHNTLINNDIKEIKVFMSSQPINNPMIQFLKDLKEHKNLIKDYKIDIQFSIGFCKSCQDKQFMKQEPSCLSGGRYCAINSEFKTNEFVKETLRQICIRDNYGVDKLINYLFNLKGETETLYFTQKFKEKDLASISRSISTSLAIEPKKIQDCLDGSFVKQNPGDPLDYNLDDNTILQKEQKEFFGITKYNIFPLVIINNVYYDQSINVREFIKFGCDNTMFDCRGYRVFKKLFVGLIATVSMVFVIVVILFCRRIMRRKMDNELSIKVNEAIQKYLTVDKA